MLGPDQQVVPIITKRQPQPDSLPALRQQPSAAGQAALLIQLGVAAEPHQQIVLEGPPQLIAVPAAALQPVPQVVAPAVQQLTLPALALQMVAVGPTQAHTVAAIASLKLMQTAAQEMQSSRAKPSALQLVPQKGGQVIHLLADSRLPRDCGTVTTGASSTPAADALLQEERCSTLQPVEIMQQHSDGQMLRRTCIGPHTSQQHLVDAQQPQQQQQRSVHFCSHHRQQLQQQQQDGPHDAQEQHHRSILYQQPQPVPGNHTAFTLSPDAASSSMADANVLVSGSRGCRCLHAKAGALLQLCLKLLEMAGTLK